MKRDWTTCKLGDLITLKRGYDLPARHRVPGSYPIVSSSGITGMHKTAKVEGPGVVTGRYGTIGDVFYVRDDFWPLNTSLYVVDFKGNDPRFIAYFLRTMNLGKQNVASAVPGVNRNYLHMLDVRKPPVATQRKIAAILSAYDDLIENNNRRIKILEKMARLIYREWFVNFRFPGYENVKMVDSPLGMIPKGWSVKNLFDVADVTYGFPFKSRLFSENPQGMPVIRIRDLKTSETDTYTLEEASGKYIVNNGGILVGMDGDFHMCKWAGGDAYLNQRVVRFRPKDGLSPYYLYLSLVDPIHYFDVTITGTTVSHLSDQNLRSIGIVIPNPEILINIIRVFDPVYGLELNLRIKNRILHHTRDLLLPKLISDDPDVSELDIDIGEDVL